MSYDLTPKKKKRKKIQGKKRNTYTESEACATWVGVRPAALWVVRRLSAPGYVIAQHTPDTPPAAPACNTLLPSLSTFVRFTLFGKNGRSDNAAS